MVVDLPYNSPMSWTERKQPSEEQAVTWLMFPGYGEYPVVGSLTSPSGWPEARSSGSSWLYSTLRTICDPGQPEHVCKTAIPDAQKDVELLSTNASELVILNMQQWLAHSPTTAYRRSRSSWWETQRNNSMTTPWLTVFMGESWNSSNGFLCFPGHCKWVHV
jgi:hypothetical protein